MAHDARREDYLRMSLRFALSLDEGSPDHAARAFASFGRRFAQSRDSLPQSDADRAFHLVSLATELLDYRLPFVGEELVEPLRARARGMLDEALALDPSCHDAARMRTGLDVASHEERLRLLMERADLVRSSCEKDRDALCELLEEPRRPLAASIAMRPWWRWLAETAECALICGRNHAALAAAEELMDADPSDLSDVRFTLAYTLVKLEDAPGLERLVWRYPTLGDTRADDAWILLSQAALAYKRLELDAARHLLGRLLEAYRSCGAALAQQVEIGDGFFARIRVPAYSEDELVVALSEGVVLLQEGVERTGKGVFGGWVAKTALELDPAAPKGPATKGAQRGASGQ